MTGHRGRVGTMAWNSHLLSSGSRDRNILQRDIRAPEDFQQKLLGHRSEVRTLSRIDERKSLIPVRPQSLNIAFRDFRGP